MAQTAPMQGEVRKDRRSPRARLLIVEDDARMRRVLEMLLADHWDVELASDGREALERAQRSTPDLVLTDLLLPGIDGFELTRELRAAPARRAPCPSWSSRASPRKPTGCAPWRPAPTTS